MIVKYWKFQSDVSLTAEEAKKYHNGKSAYVISIHDKGVLFATMNFNCYAMTIRYYDKNKRWRWACNWTDEIGCNTNQLSSIYCFVYDQENSGDEENYKSYFYRYNDNDERKDFIRYFHLGTGKTTKRVFSERRTYSLPFPEFGKYEDYLSFPYQEEFPELEEWPESIFPTGEKPRNNVPIPHIQL